MSGYGAPIKSLVESGVGGVRISGYVACIAIEKSFYKSLRDKIVKIKAHGFSNKLVTKPFKCVGKLNLQMVKISITLVS